MPLSHGIAWPLNARQILLTWKNVNGSHLPVILQISRNARNIGSSRRKHCTVI